MKIFFSALLVHVCAISFAQTWTNFNTSNSGLLSNGIACVNVDLQGNLWVGYGGTNHYFGVQKFDGSTWQTFNISNSGLPSNDVTSIVHDLIGNIWIGTNGAGLAKFDGVNWAVYDTSNSNILDNSISKMNIDSNNIIWMSHFQVGVSEFIANDFKTYFYPKDSFMMHNCITDFFFDSIFVWMSAECNDGIIKFNRSDSTCTFLNGSNSSMPSNYVTAIDMDRNKNLWMGYLIGFYGVSKYEGNIITNYSPFGTSWVFDLAVDTNDNVYVGVRGDALYKYNGANWGQVPPPLPTTGVSVVVYCDHYNRIWYSEANTGLWVSDIGNGIKEEKGGNFNFSAFPNPSNSELNIFLELKQVDDLTIDLYNSMGQLVTENTFVHKSGAVKTKIDLVDFSKGIYLLTIRTKDSSSSKVIIVN